MKARQLAVFRSPHARKTSASLPRGTYFIVSVRVEFLPGGIANYDRYGVLKLTDGRVLMCILNSNPPGGNNFAMPHRSGANK